MDAVKIRAHGFFGKMLVTVKALLAEAIETADSLKLDGQSIQAVNTPTDKLLDKAKFYFQVRRCFCLFVDSQFGIQISSDVLLREKDQLLNMFFHASFFPKRYVYPLKPLNSSVRLLTSLFFVSLHLSPRIDPGKEVSVGLFPLIGVFESIGFDFGPAADKTYLRDGRFSFHDQHVHSVTGASDLRLGSDMAKIGLSKDTPAAFAVLVAFDPETSDVEITFLVVLRGDLEAAADFAVTQSDNFANPSTFMSTFERETSTLPLNEGKAIYNTVIVMMKQIIQCLEDN